MFHVLFCQSNQILNGQTLAHWMIETAAFEDIPRFEPDFPDLDDDWHVLSVVYAEEKRPIQFQRLERATCDVHVESAVEALRDQGLFEEQAPLVERLRQSKQVYLIEFDEYFADEEVWEFLDTIEMRLARALGGIIFASDEGFFDERNQAICEFRS